MDQTVREDRSSKHLRLREAPRDGAHRLREVWHWLGVSGDKLGLNGTLARTFFYSYLFAAVLVASVNIINVVTIQHEQPDLGLAKPAIWEGSSWVSLIAFYWIVWIAYRVAPLNVRPRWRLLVHLPGALLFSLCHVSGFVALRNLAYLAAGAHYHYGPFVPNFLYELRKDALGYSLFVVGMALIEHLLRQPGPIEAPGLALTFDIRDGAKLTRVKLDEVLAVSSAGNYVEFVLRDGRRLLMRSSLSAMEDELGGRGFLRTHRSWLVNVSRVTALRPDGSGDYTVELECIMAPVSRRFPQALARLRGD